jgi:hypothetical protein
VESGSERMFPGKYDKEKINYDKFAKIYVTKNTKYHKVSFNKKYFDHHYNHQQKQMDSMNVIILPTIHNSMQSRISTDNRMKLVKIVEI